jgi:hypothetical protein
MGVVNVTGRHLFCRPARMRIQNMQMISEWSREGRCCIIFKSQAVLLDRRPAADGKFSLAAALNARGGQNVLHFNYSNDLMLDSIS